MSGTEVIAIVGLISSVISIVQTSRNLYDTANDIDGLHEAFRAVAQNVPLVLNILNGCKTVQEGLAKEYEVSTDADQKREIETTAEAVKPVMLKCKENAEALKDIFEKVVPGEEAKWLERYKKAAKSMMPGKKKKVEELMKEMLEKLQLLQTSRFFQAEIERRSQKLQDGITQLSELDPSLPEENGSFSHYGSGPQNVNTGDGIQHNYTQSGGSNNRQFNGQTMYFGKE
ncbi:hypothetical protein Q7P37_002795 [Cladosporium fusiforme]